MCDFCSNILPVTEYKAQFEWEYDEKDALVLAGDEVYLYTTCEDTYYNGCSMKVMYCPKCGRKVTNNE